MIHCWIVADFGSNVVGYMNSIATQFAILVLFNIAWLLAVDEYSPRHHRLESLGMAQT